MGGFAGPGAAMVTARLFPFSYPEKVSAPSINSGASGLALSCGRWPLYCWDFHVKLLLLLLLSCSTSGRWDLLQGAGCGLSPAPVLLVLEYFPTS